MPLGHIARCTSWNPFYLREVENHASHMWARLHRHAGRQSGAARARSTPAPRTCAPTNGGAAFHHQDAQRPRSAQHGGIRRPILRTCGGEAAILLVGRGGWLCVKAPHRRSPQPCGALDAHSSCLIGDNKSAAVVERPKCPAARGCSGTCSTPSVQQREITKELSSAPLGVAALLFIYIIGRDPDGR